MISSETLKLFKCHESTRSDNFFSMNIQTISRFNDWCNIMSWPCCWNQAKYRFTTNVQRRLYGRATDVVIRPLDEAKAVGLAAEFLGELVIFTVTIYHIYLLRFFSLSRLQNCITIARSAWYALLPIFVDIFFAYRPLEINHNIKP